MTRSEKTVGVIGGMGPAATVEYARRLVEAVPARDDRDHLHVLIDNNPKIPSRIAALIEGGGEDPTPTLIAMALGLERAGADLLAIPCNTAHHYRVRIAQAVRIPVLDAVALSVARLSALSPPPKKVGLLASPALKKIALFDAPLEAAKMTALYPERAGEDALFDIIRAVKAGEREPSHEFTYHAVAAALADTGADALLVACTELSLLPAPTLLPTIDTLSVLVEETVRAARG